MDRGIEVEGNPYLARMINASMASLLNTFRDDVHFGGAASGGLCSDAYAGGTGGGWGASDSARSSHPSSPPQSGCDSCRGRSQYSSDAVFCDECLPGQPMQQGMSS